MLVITIIGIVALFVVLVLVCYKSACERYKLLEHIYAVDPD